MRAFDFNGADGTFAFADATRQALAVPTGRLVGMLPEELEVDDADLVYPDVGKAGFFSHVWQIAYNAFTTPRHFGTESGRALISAVPQEYATSGVIAAVPDGADIFRGRLKVQRLAAPATNWVGGALPLMCPEDKWISPHRVIFEAGIGFVRTLYIYITGGNLVWHIQQSVGTAPGGYGDHPGDPGGEPAAIGIGPYGGDETKEGGETTYSTAPGWPYYYAGDASPQLKGSGAPLETNVTLTVTVPRTHRQSGGDPPSSPSAPTLSSTLRFTLRGRFGRRT